METIGYKTYTAVHSVTPNPKTVSKVVPKAKLLSREVLKLCGVKACDAKVRRIEIRSRSRLL